MRTDATQNRTRILDAARELYAADGVETTMRAVAHRAGVGMATLYRHFPTREALFTAAFEAELARCVRLTEDALADLDAWRGLRTALDHAVGSQTEAGSWGFTKVFAAEFPDAGGMTDGRARILRNISELARRAQESGDLRADFSPSDLILLIQVTDSLGATSPAAARRLVAYLMQSFSARTAPLPAPEPMAMLGVSLG